MADVTEAQTSVMRRRRSCNVGGGVPYTCPFMCPHKKKSNGVKSGLGRLSNQFARSTDLDSAKSHQKAVTIASIAHMNTKTSVDSIQSLKISNSQKKHNITKNLLENRTLSSQFPTEKEKENLQGQAS
ncbi:hypothetical protein AVEN_153610-1 [Araneus ventricosus]|uniref:Uncharacterized protein n=1 Tax=Araneus ventricosus TaxID=182803 RepID=A0A4Y2BPH7_ARAVE|nr:hypothetical protein AVEN_153610-1 [Araneus ventricosus]